MQQFLKVRKSSHKNSSHNFLGSIPMIKACMKAYSQLTSADFPPLPTPTVRGTPAPTNSPVVAIGTPLDDDKMLWPRPMFNDYLDNNDSRSRSGTTVNGTTWKYSENNMRDSEDNDTDYKFTLGELQIVRSDESSRDFAEDKTSVTYKGQTIFQSNDMRCRDGHNQPEKYSGLEELEKALNAVATIEGVTLKKLLSALPISLPADVYRLHSS